MNGYRRQELLQEMSVDGTDCGQRSLSGFWGQIRFAQLVKSCVIVLARGRVIVLAESCWNLVATRCLMHCL